MKQWTADRVLDAVAKRGALAHPAVEFVRNVRSHTGFSGESERYADAVAVSVYPSRGLWIAGVEVKVSRSDWLRELREPEKAEKIAKACDFWWVAAPAGIVRLDEVPASWGLLEVDGAGKVRAAKQAPRREAAPLTLGFVASLFRGLAKREAAAELRGRDRAAQELAERPDVAELEAALQVERIAVDHERRSAERRKIDLDRLAARVAAFEQRTGIKIDDLALPRVEELVRFLGRGQATQLAGTMRRVADELDALSKGPSP